MAIMGDYTTVINRDRGYCVYHGVQLSVVTAVLYILIIYTHLATEYIYIYIGTMHEKA